MALLSPPNMITPSFLVMNVQREKIKERLLAHGDREQSTSRYLTPVQSTIQYSPPPAGRNVDTGSIIYDAARSGATDRRRTTDYPRLPPAGRPKLSLGRFTPRLAPGRGDRRRKLRGVPIVISCLYSTAASHDISVKFRSVDLVSSTNIFAEDRLKLLAADI